MDPDEALKDLLDDLKEAEEGITKPERFYEQFEALHGWIVKGGFLPKAWQPKPDNDEYQAALKVVLDRNNAEFVHFVCKNDGPDALFKKALELLNRDYNQDVRSNADDALQELLSGDITSDDGLTEHIESACESHCTYTVQAQAVVLCSKNDSYGIDEGLVDCSKGIDWSALATWAMRQDVYEALGQLEESDKDLETDDPLEKFCEWKEIDGEEDETVSVATLTFDDVEYEGRGNDREAALSALRTSYSKRLGVPPVVEERPADG